jgi:hypothetical protein
LRSSGRAETRSGRYLSGTVLPFGEGDARSGEVVGGCRWTSGESENVVADGNGFRLAVDIERDGADAVYRKAERGRACAADPVSVEDGEEGRITWPEWSVSTA